MDATNKIITPQEGIGKHTSRSHLVQMITSKAFICHLEENYNEEQSGGNEEQSRNVLNSLGKVSMLEHPSDETKDLMKEVIETKPIGLMKGAVKEDNPDALDAILTNANAVPDDVKGTMLTDALKQGNQHILRVLKKHDALEDPKSRDSAAPSAIAQAVEGNNPLFLEELVTAGFDVDKTDTRDLAPIQIAAREGNTDCAKTLINAGCDVEVEHGGNDSPFLEAMMSAMQSTGSGELEVAKLLSDAGCDVNKLGLDGNAAIHAATIEGSIQQVQFLIKTAKVKLDVEAGSSIGPGYTALHMAIQFTDKPEVAQELINAGCDLNKTSDDKNETALHLALGVPGHLQATYVNMLLKEKCSVDIQDRFGNTPLHICKHSDILEILVKAAPYECLSLKNYVGQTPLHYAVDRGFDVAVNLMLDRNADPNIMDVQGDSALHMASKDETRKKGLCDEYAFITNTTTEFAKNYDYPLQNIAIGSGLTTDTYKRLMDRMNDVDTQNNEGQTPLQIAIQYNCVKTAKALLEAGADAFSLYDVSGQNAYYLATAKPGVVPEIIGMMEQSKPTRHVPFMKVIDMLTQLMKTVQTDPLLSKRDVKTFDSAIGNLNSLLTKNLPKDFPMPLEHRNILKKSRSILIDEVVPKGILDILKASGIFDQNDVADVMEERGRPKQCEKMLDILIYRGRQAFPVFCKAMAQTTQTYILELMKNKVETELVCSDQTSMLSKPQTGRPTLDEHREFLRLNRNKLIQSMMKIPFENLMKRILSFRIINKCMASEVLQSPNEQSRCEIILDILPKCGRYAFPTFCVIMETLDFEDEETWNIHISQASDDNEKSS